MDNVTSHISQLAELNPCIKFIIDNYDMLCLAHYGKVVMVMDNPVAIDEAPAAYVAKTFDSVIGAMMFTKAMNMGHIPYALKECIGDDATNNLMYSIGCQTPN